VNIGACDGVTNTYQVDIDLAFSSPPAGGTLTVNVCGTIQTFFPPFVSPMTIPFTGLPVGVGTCNVTCTFSADPTCTIGLSYTAPADCSCPADAGTFTSTLNGSGTTNFITCFGDDVDIVGNGDFVAPADNTPLFGITYDPGLWLMVYSCPPTVFAPADLFDPITGLPTDPCYLGIESTADGVWNIANTVGDGSTLYYVPITMYSMVDGYYSVTNSLISCYELGAPIPITFLPDITAVGVQNCAAGTVTITVSGGHPAVFGTNFTASGLLPATASFTTSTCGNGGTIVISGLNNGDMYSCTITDVNGCPHTFTGGPFIGPSLPIINPAGPFCATDPATNLTASLPGGTWTSTCGACLTAGGTFNPATAGVGTYTVTYTIPGCSTPDTETIIVQDLVITSIAVTNVTCFGLNNGTITITAPGATQFSIDNGITFQASNVFTVGPGTYNVVVTSPGGCSDNGTATITEPALLTAIPGGQDETCFGACDGFAVVAPGGGSGGYIFSWTGPATGTNALLPDLCSGTYNITVTDANGCIATATQIINGAVAVTITSAPVTNVLCNGSATGSITINASASTALTYNINGGIFQASNVFSGLVAGTYVVIAQDINGCSASTTVTITEPTAVTVVAGADQTICIGATANLTANAAGGVGPYTYTWTNNVDATVLTGANQTVSPVANTTYTVSVTDNNGCGPVTDGTIITINPPLGVVATLTQSICPGGSAILNAVANGGNGIYTYTWTNNIDASTLSGASQTVSPTVTTTYTVTVTDNCGTPSATDVVIITIYPLPAVNLTPTNASGCSPLSVDFVNLTLAGPTATYTWDFGDGSTGNGANITHVYSNNTNSTQCFDISLNIVTSDGCLVDTTIFGAICVFPIPIADFSFGPQPADIFNTEINFTNLTIGGSTYAWDFAGLGTSTQTNPIFVFPTVSGSIYNVCLSTISANGCIDSTCSYVIIDDVFLLYVPNTFTPDGDNINEIFIPIIQGEKPETYELFIFNRWGEVIFQSNNKDIGWDGTHKNIKSKEDVYVWKLRVKKKINEEKVEYVGHVTLLR
jgi:gliding motility-associated-like protein